MDDKVAEKVQVKLEFKADSAQARGEMAATRKEVEKLGVESRKTQQEMSRVGSGGAGGGGTGGVGAGAGGAGGVGGGFMAVLAKAAVALTIFKQAVEGASKGIAAYYGDKYANKTVGAVTEGLNSLFMGIPQGLADNYMGIRFARSNAEKMKGYEREDIFNVMQSGNLAWNQQYRSLNEQRAATRDSYEAQMGISRNARLWHGQFGTDPGQTDPRFRQSIKEIAGADAGVVIGERAFSRAETERKRLHQLTLEAGHKVSLESNAPLEDGNPFAFENRATKVRMANKELLQREIELQAALENQQKVGLDLEQKRSQLRQANLNYSKAELEIAKERESKAKSQASEFGMMSGSDKLALKYALQQAQSQGIDALPEDSRNLLARSGLTGEWARDQSEKSVQDDPVYQSIVKALGGKTSSQQTKDRITLENKIEFDTEIDAEELANGFKVQWDHFFERIGPLVRTIADQQLTVVLNQRKQVEK